MSPITLKGENKQDKWGKVQLNSTWYHVTVIPGYSYSEENTEFRVSLPSTHPQTTQRNKIPGILKSKTIFISQDYLRINRQLTEFFTAKGITQATTQAEFLPPGQRVCPPLQPCLMPCFTLDCRLRNCCVDEDDLLEGVQVQQQLVHRKKPAEQKEQDSGVSSSQNHTAAVGEVSSDSQHCRKQ